MLPIFRVLPVGGVLLAILILVLALTPPDGFRAPLSSPGVPARGALSDRDRQAETRQFLIHAALKRAGELSRLRDLPGTPTHSEDPQPQLAGLPGERSDADPEESSSISETPAINIPFELGGPAIEGPIPSPQDTPVTLTRPEQSKTQQETRRRAQRPRHTRVTDTQPRQLNFFEVLFGQQSASISQQADRSLTPILCSVRNRQARSSLNIRPTVISKISNRRPAASRPVISNISNQRTPASRPVISNSIDNRPRAISRLVGSSINHSPATQANRRVSLLAPASATFP